MQSSFYVIPTLTIHPDRVNCYHKVQWHGHKPLRDRAETLKGVSTDHKGKVSSVARRKISKALRYLLFMANDKVLPNTAKGKSYKFKIAFVTLTLPSEQIHSDNEIKAQCLNQFLIEAKKKWNVVNYVWRAEKQKNGNIHFHILVDRFIPWSELRDVWNRIINKLGYIERYRDNMIAFHRNGFTARTDLLTHWSITAQKIAYKKGKANDWRSPNTTDIHSVYKINNIEKYLSKYYCKDEQNSGLKGRLWGSNYELSNVKGAVIEIDSFVDAELSVIQDFFNAKSYSGSYFTVFFLSIYFMSTVPNSLIYSHFKAYMLEHFHFDLSEKQGYT